MQNFTLKATLFFAFLLSASLGKAQTTITTVGIIGSATPRTATNTTGWDASTPMTRTVAGGNDWTITLQLTAATGSNEVKFRANDAWTINWGAAAFPSGTGVQDGPNIVIPTAGRYLVRFNSQTGAYSFSIVTAAKTSNDFVLRMALAPNPARGNVSVVYDLAKATTAAVKVLNLVGQTVRQLAPVQQGVGSQQQELALQGLAAGIYLVQLQTADQVQTTRLVVE
ncbi:T9SS type A sorting domain-containing protein [Hymenobacter sp. BT523]|uniref:T9SS type A sorting domain-containing protein n=1 Tax=Hymenobacter sp. BT523 TaxID=2795725 RepID=UPI0018EC6904|nr:T9SS type A sorting domain-containing protein [Hymenobacter sp. BT523]MBJ6111028.1 T9SS type A sorting domain-containing protein [Hymenobacter sp. BT523]